MSKRDTQEDAHHLPKAKLARIEPPTKQVFHPNTPEWNQMQVHVQTANATTFGGMISKVNEVDVQKSLENFRLAMLKPNTLFQVIYDWVFQVKQYVGEENMGKTFNKAVFHAALSVLKEVNDASKPQMYEDENGIIVEKFSLKPINNIVYISAVANMCLLLVHENAELKDIDLFWTLTQHAWSSRRELDNTCNKINNRLNELGVN